MRLVPTVVAIALSDSIPCSSHTFTMRAQALTQLPPATFYTRTTGGSWSINPVETAWGFLDGPNYLYCDAVTKLVFSMEDGTDFKLLNAIVMSDAAAKLRVKYCVTATSCVSQTVRWFPDDNGWGHVKFDANKRVTTVHILPEGANVSWGEITFQQ